MIRSRSYLAMVMMMTFVIIILNGCGPSGTPALPFPAPPWKKTLPTAGPKPQSPGTTIRSPVDEKDPEFNAAYRLMEKGKVAEFLLMLEDDPELIGWEHQSAGGFLNVAAGYGQILIVQYLLEHGANPNSRDMFGATPLHNCLIRAGNIGLQRTVDYVGIADLLLTHGADINATVYPLTDRSHTGAIEVSHKDSLLEIGERLQRSKGNDSIVRNGVMARLREHLELPVDALLPLNATSRYQQLRKSK